MPTKPRVGYQTAGRWGHLTPVGQSNDEWFDAGGFEGGIQLKVSGYQRDLSPIPEGVLETVMTSDDLSGKRQRAKPCAKCGEPLGTRVTPSRRHGEYFCEQCSDAVSLSFIGKPKAGRPKKQKGNGQ